MIRLLLNMNKKLYIIVNNKQCNKGKIARACATIGQYNPNYSRVIVLKGGNSYNELLNSYKSPLIYDAPGYNSIGKFSGEYVDAGLTQVNSETSLAFGVICNDNEKIDLPLY